MWLMYTDQKCYSVVVLIKNSDSTHCAYQAKKLYFTPRHIHFRTFQDVEHRSRQYLDTLTSPFHYHLCSLKYGYHPYSHCIRTLQMGCNWLI